MKEKIDRRSFLKTGTALGAASFLGGSVLSSCNTGSAKAKRTDVDVAVATGENYYNNTVKAVEALGGMGAFVTAGSRVAILANPQRNNPGAFTKPALLKAVITMCKKAGAETIDCISQLPEKNWIDTELKAVLDELEAGLVLADRKDETQFKTVPIPKGTALPEAAIMKALDNYNILIDMPITKDHAGNKFTGTMKNFMGISSGPTNRSFHKPQWTTDPDAIAHLEQCIADLNTIVTPDLCVVDATEFITTNGPFGPGEMAKPMKVVAGTDRVAIDSYCSTLLGYTGVDILQIKNAYALGLGEIDLAKVTVKEITV